MAKDKILTRYGVSGYNKPKRTPSHKTKSHVVVAKEKGKVKKYKAYYAEITSGTYQPDDSFSLEIKLVNGLIKLYEYYVHQIDKSFALLDRKAQEKLEMISRNNKLLSADNLIVTGGKL